MSPVVVLLAGMLIVFLGASGKWEAVWKAITGGKK